MSSIEKIIDRIPYSDGGFRRRLSAGVIVVMGAVFFISINRNVSTEPLEKLITNPTVAIILVVLTYALGGLVEAIAELFVTRLTGNLAWAWSQPRRIANRVHRFLQPFVLIFSFYPGIFFILMAEFGKAMAGKSSFSWDDLDENFHKDSRTFFAELPEVVRIGLQKPFGEFSDLAWHYLVKLGDQSTAALLRRLEARNKDVLVIVTALSIFLVLAPFFVLPSLTTSLGASNFLVLLQIAVMLPVVLLTTYYLLVKQSIITAIESLTLARAEYDHQTHQGHNQPMQRMPDGAAD